MKSRLVKLAKTQKAQANIAALLNFNLRRGAIEPRRRSRAEREIKAWINCALDNEKDLQAIVMGQPRDFADNGDLVLIEAINRLTAFRIDRIQYAGRVLP